MAVIVDLNGKSALNPVIGDEWYFKDYAYAGAKLFAMGAALSAAAAVAGVVALPTATVAGATCAGASLISWAASEAVFNYNDPRDLQAFRNMALAKPLLSSIHKHGWDAMIRYDILTYPEAKDKFLRDTEHWDMKKITDAFGWNEINKRQLWTYEQARWKYEQTVTGMSQETYAKYFTYNDFDWLVTYNLITPSECQNWIYFKSSMLTFHEMVSQLGWNRILKGDIVHPDQLKWAFHQETRLLTGMQFVERYSLQDIACFEDAGLVSSELRALLVGVVDHYNTKLGELERLIARLERVFNAEIAEFNLEKDNALAEIRKEKEKALIALEKQLNNMHKDRYAKAIQEIEAAAKEDIKAVKKRYAITLEKIEARLDLEMASLDSQVTELKANVNFSYASLQW